MIILLAAEDILALAPACFFSYCLSDKYPAGSQVHVSEIS